MRVAAVSDMLKGKRVAAIEETVALLKHEWDERDVRSTPLVMLPATTAIDSIPSRRQA